MSINDTVQEPKTGWKAWIDMHLERTFGNYRKDDLTWSQMQERDKYQAQIVYSKKN